MYCNMIPDTEARPPRRCTWCRYVCFETRPRIRHATRRRSTRQNTSAGCPEPRSPAACRADCTVVGDTHTLAHKVDMAVDTWCSARMAAADTDKAACHMSRGEKVRLWRKVSYYKGAYSMAWGMGAAYGHRRWVHQESWTLDLCLLGK